MIITAKTVADAASLVATQYSAMVRKAEGYLTGTDGTNYWLQLHNKLSAPATDDVPIRSVQIFPNNGFTFSWEGTELGFSVGVIAIISITKAAYTAVAGAETMELQLDMETTFPQGTSLAGNLTSNRGTLQVWSEATGIAGTANMLYALWIQNNSGANAWVLVYAEDSATNNVPILVIPIGLASTFNFLTFGDGGKLILGNPDLAGNNARGCTIRLSGVGTYPYTQIATGTNHIQAAYKNI